MLSHLTSTDSLEADPPHLYLRRGRPSRGAQGGTTPLTKRQPAASANATDSKRVEVRSPQVL